MSLKAVAHVLNSEAWEDSTQFLVAIAVANYTGPGGVCFAKYETLAKFSRLSKRTVGDAIRQMIDARQLTASRRRRTNGTLGVYVLEIPGMADPRYEAKPEAADDISEGQELPRGKEAAVATPKGKQLPRSNLRTPYPEDSNPSVQQAAPDTQAAFNAYNERARMLGLSIAEKMTEERKTKLKTRIQESGIEGWTRALANIERSRFLMGERKTERGFFKLTLNFLLVPANLQKLIEGGFDDGRRPTVAPADASKAYQERLRTDERFARTMAHQWTQDPDRWPPEAGPPPGQPGCVLPISVQDAVLGRGSPTGADALAHGVHALAQQHAHDDLVGVDLGREHQPDDEVPL